MDDIYNKINNVWQKGITLINGLDIDINMLEVVNVH